MTNTNLMIAGLTGCLFFVSCNPLPVGPDPRYRPSRYTQDDQRRDVRRDQVPDGRYGNDRFGDNRYDSGRYGDNRYDDNRYDGGRGPAPEPQPAPQPTRDQYPTAERTNNPNQVLSPYPPYNVIDVEGFRTGQLAKDPSNGKIFRVP